MKKYYIDKALSGIHVPLSFFNRIKKITILFYIIILAKISYSQPLHEYFFNSNFLGTNGAPDLIEKLNCSATSGSFINETITFSNGLGCSNATVFSFTKGGGLSYPNPNYINKQYSINMVFEIETFPNTLPKWIRLIDFFNLTSDDGVYFYDSSLVFYYNYGNHSQGTPLYFKQKTYYLLTMTRNQTDDSLKIYVNGNLFAASKDTKNFFPATSNTPINFFTDDGIVTCEAQPGHIKYLSITSQLLNSDEINSLWANICPIVMPVNITNFNIECINNSSKKITWNTGAEVNNDYFTLERSTDAVHWGSVKKIKSKGNRKSLDNQYSESDNYNSNGKPLYYRLKQTDYSGKFIYHEIKAAPGCNKLSGRNEDLMVYPNPVQNQLIVNTSKNSIGQNYNIIDNAGRKIMTGQITGENNIINMDQVAAGIYLLQLDQNKQFTKIIKK